MRLRPTRRAGLSLLEVLVSLAIFLMSLIALTHLVNTSSGLAGEARHRSRAALLARSKMNEFISGALPLQGQGDSSFDDEPDYRWSADVSDGGATGLSNVTVTVTYKPEDPYPIKISFSRMVFDSQYAGSTQDVPAPPDGSSDSLTDPSSSGSSGSSGSGSSSGSSSGGASSGAASKGASGASMGGASAGSASKGASGASMGGASAGSASKGSSGAGVGAGSSGAGAGMGSKGGATSGAGTGGKGK